MTMIKTISILSAGVAGLAIVLPAAAIAQGGDTSEGASDGQGSSQDIVVTAQRREERVQDIPIAISAFGSEQIAAAGVVSIANLAPRVPSVYFGSFGANRPQLYIRGIGSRQYDPGSESSVGVFTDEVYLGRSSGSFSQLKDIERIEVLRGPQGTLYGRNTIGGAINVISKAPTPEFRAEAEAGISNYDGYNLFGAVGGPLNASKTLMFRVAGWRDKRDGYLLNLETGNRFQGVDNTGGRIRLAWEPDSRLRVDLEAEYLHDGNGAGFDGFNQGTGPSVSGAPANPNSVFFVSPSKLPLLTPTKSLYAGYNNIDPTLDRDAYSYIGRVEYDFDFATLTSISAYHKLNADDSRDLDGSSLFVINTASRERSKQFTQEIRLTSDPNGSMSFGGKLDWIVGGFYYNDNTHRRDDYTIGPDSVVRAALGTSTVDSVDAKYGTKSYAAFGQATLHLGDFDFTIGGRYSRDSKHVTYVGSTTDAFPLITAPFVVPVRATYTSFDPRFVVKYNISQDVNVYASYSTGFKSGGFQYVPFNPAAATERFKPERVRAFEAGVKSQFLDRRAQLNLTGFHYDYRNLQVNRIVDSNSGPQTLISSAESSTIYGVELEAVLRPTEYFNVNVTYGDLHARYDKYEFNLSQNLVFDGTTMVRAPTHSINVGGEYRVPVGNGKLTFAADYALLSTFFFEPGEGDNRFGSGVPLTREPGYGLLNLRTAYEIGAFRVTGYATNVGNVKYRRSAQGLSSGIVGFAGEPRIYGLKVAWSY